MVASELPPSPFSLRRSMTLFARALRSALLFLLLVYLVFLSSGTSGWTNPVLLAAVVLVWLVLRKTHTGIELPVIGFAAVLALTSLLSIDPRRSLAQAGQISTGFLILLMAPEIARWAGGRARLAGMVLALGGLYMAWAWWDASRWYLAWLETSPGQWLPGISFRLNGSNNIAAYLNVVLMMAVGWGLLARRNWQRVLLGVYALSAALLIFLTSSRGGWIGTAAGLAALAGLHLSQGGRWGRLKMFLSSLATNRRLRWVTAAALALAVLAAGLLIWLYLNGMGSHLTHGPAATARSDFWPPAWNAFVRSPVWGSGLNTFASFQMQSYSYPPFNIFLHAHNQYLDVLAGSGLLGAAALVWLLAALARRAWRLLPGIEEQHRIVWLGAAGALVSFLAHGVFDGLYRMPFASLSLVLLVGAALGESLPKEIHAKRWGLWLSTGFALLTAGWGLYGAWRVEPLAQAVQAFEQGHWVESSRLMDEAILRDPGNATAHQQRALVYSFLAQQGQSEALDEAIRSMQAAARLDPTWGLNDANLGALYRAAGRLDESAAAFEQAVRAAPEAVVYYLNLGEVQELRGDSQAARAAYSAALEYAQAQALARDTLGISPAAFWRATEVRLAAAAVVEPAAGDRPTRQEREARVSEGSGAAIDFIQLAGYAVEEGQFQEARRRLDQAKLAYFRVPADHLELYWQEAGLAAAQGDLGSAVHWGEQALDGTLRQGIYGPGSYGQVNYAADVFGVPAVSPDLVPQLTIISLPDAWGRRMAQLIAWNRKLGNIEQAQELEAQLQRLNPDLDEREQP